MVNRYQHEEEVKRWLESIDAEFKLDDTGRVSYVSFEYAYRTFFYPELVHLKRMTGMKDLNFTATQITDADLEHFKEMTGLERLYLNHTQITDAGLVHLKGLKDLQNFRP